MQRWRLRRRRVTWPAGTLLLQLHRSIRLAMLVLRASPSLSRTCFCRGQLLGSRRCFSGLDGIFDALSVFVRDARTYEYMLPHAKSLGAICDKAAGATFCALIVAAEAVVRSVLSAAHATAENETSVNLQRPNKVSRSTAFAFAIS